MWDFFVRLKFLSTFVVKNKGKRRYYEKEIFVDGHDGQPDDRGDERSGCNL
jgi:hypothetical protein